MRKLPYFLANTLAGKIKRERKKTFLFPDKTSLKLFGRGGADITGPDPHTNKNSGPDLDIKILFVLVIIFLNLNTKIIQILSFEGTGSNCG